MPARVQSVVKLVGCTTLMKLLAPVVSEGLANQTLK